MPTQDQCTCEVWWRLVKGNWSYRDDTVFLFLVTATLTLTRLTQYAKGSGAYPRPTMYLWSLTKIGQRELALSRWQGFSIFSTSDFDLSLYQIYLSSIVKEAFSLFEPLSSPLPGTNQYWCHMRDHDRDPWPRDWAADTLTTTPPLPLTSPIPYAIGSGIYSRPMYLWSLKKIGQREVELSRWQGSFDARPPVQTTTYPNLIICFFFWKPG